MPLEEIERLHAMTVWDRFNKCIKIQSTIPSHQRAHLFDSLEDPTSSELSPSTATPEPGNPCEYCFCVAVEVRGSEHVGFDRIRTPGQLLLKLASKDFLLTHFDDLFSYM